MRDYDEAMFVSTINSVKVILTATQVKALADILSDSEVIDSDYKKGDDGKYFNLYYLSDFDSERITFSLLTEGKYNALKFATAARKDAADK